MTEEQRDTIEWLLREVEMYYCQTGMSPSDQAWKNVEEARKLLLPESEGKEKEPEK